MASLNCRPSVILNHPVTHKPPCDTYCSCQRMPHCLTVVSSLPQDAVQEKANAVGTLRRAARTQSSIRRLSSRASASNSIASGLDAASHAAALPAVQARQKQQGQGHQGHARQQQGQQEQQQQQEYVHQNEPTGQQGKPTVKWSQQLTHAQEQHQQQGHDREQQGQREHMLSIQQGQQQGQLQPSYPSSHLPSFQQDQDQPGQLPPSYPPSFPPRRLSVPMPCTPAALEKLTSPFATHSNIPLELHPPVLSMQEGQHSDAELADWRRDSMASSSSRSGLAGRPSVGLSPTDSYAEVAGAEAAADEAEAADRADVIRVLSIRMLSPQDRLSGGGGQRSRGTAASQQQAEPLAAPSVGVSPTHRVASNNAMARHFSDHSAASHVSSVAPGAHEAAPSLGASPTHSTRGTRREAAGRLVRCTSPTRASTMDAPGSSPLTAGAGAVGDAADAALASRSSSDQLVWLPPARRASSGGSSTRSGRTRSTRSGSGAAMSVERSSGSFSSSIPERSAGSTDMPDVATSPTHSGRRHRVTPLVTAWAGDTSDGALGDTEQEGPALGFSPTHRNSRGGSRVLNAGPGPQQQWQEQQKQQLGQEQHSEPRDVRWVHRDSFGDEKAAAEAAHHAPRQMGNPWSLSGRNVQQADAPTDAAAAAFHAPAGPEH